MRIWNKLALLGVLLSPLIFLSSTCDGNCENKPDLFVPSFVDGTVLVAREFNYTVVGGLDFPFGTDVYLTNTVNEFYSVVRTSPVNGQAIVFYWNINSPPPFFQGAFPPNHPLQIGETVYIHRCVVNQGNLDFDCLASGDAGSSKTELRTVVKVENGQIVDTQERKELTPSIPAGQYRVVRFPVEINEFGSYQLKFKVNVDNRVSERDTTNNEFIERPTDNLRGGG